jgi:hypothetical protein
VLSGTTITLYTYNKYREAVRLEKKKANKNGNRRHKNDSFPEACDEKC